MYVEDIPNEKEPLARQLARLWDRWQDRFGTPPREIWVGFGQSEAARAALAPEHRDLVRERAGLYDGKIWMGPVPEQVIQKEMSLR